MPVIPERIIRMLRVPGCLLARSAPEQIRVSLPADWQYVDPFKRADREWSEFNRSMCDLLHRGIDPTPRPERVG